MPDKFGSTEAAHSSRSSSSSSSSSSLSTSSSSVAIKLAHSAQPPHCACFLHNCFHFLPFAAFLVHDFLLFPGIAVVVVVVVGAGVGLVSEKASGRASGRASGLA